MESDFYLFLFRMRKLIFGICLLVVLFLSNCSDDTPIISVQPQPKPMLVHPLFFQEEINSLINFPFWFNDSIIRSQKIQSVLWTNFGTTDEQLNELEDSQPFPKKTIRYTFNKRGKLIHIQLTDFSEGIIISHQSFSIYPTSTQFSYATQLNNSYGVANSTNVYLPDGIKTNYQVFHSVRTNQRIHFIPNSAFWGGLAVDSLAHPKPEDWIVLGKPSKPEKRYRVLNMVKEKQVTNYTYYQSNFPKEIINGDYPFTRKRSFLYEKNGLLKSFIDSTFIDRSFVTRSVHQLVIDEEGKLTRIVQRKGHSEQQKAYSTTEKIEYTYIQSKQQDQ